MQHKFFYVTSIMVLVMVSIMSFTNNTFNGYATSIKGTSENTKAQVAYVYPNPESGILNLFCCTGLKAPLSMILINAKGNTIKTIPSLVVSGKVNHNYVQITTNEIAKGEYNIVVSDVSGKTFSRKIFIQK